MNKKELVKELIEKAKELDARGSYHQADEIEKQIRLANQADNWGNIGNGLNELGQWLTPGLNTVKGIGAVKNLLDPAFKGLHDNTGRLQNDLVQFSTDLNMSLIEPRFKQELSSTINQALQYSKNMNTEYFEQNHPGVVNQNQAEKSVSQGYESQNRNYDELMKSVSSNNRFRRVVAQGVPGADTATSLFNKLSKIKKDWEGYIRTDTSGYKETFAFINQAIQGLQYLAQQESANQVPAQEVSQVEKLQQIETAYADPEVQTAVKAYLRYGLKFGPDKMFAVLEANAQNQDIGAFRTILKSSWTSEYQNAYNSKRSTAK